MSTPPAAVQPARHGRVGLADAWARVRSPLAFDVALAVVLALVTVAGSVGESHPHQASDKPPAGVHIAAPAAAYLLVVVSALALIWRRRRPVLVLAVSLGATLLYICLGYFGGAAMLNPMFALYAVAVAVPTGRAIGLAVITMLSLMAATAAFGPFGTGGGFVLIPGEVAVALFLGLWVASRAAALREREEQARRAVDAERLRIARELHDVVAHTMATINVQAGVAAHVIDQQPEQAAEALEAIKQASKEGLRELRGILNVLRQADEHDPRSPAPRLAQLDELVENATRAGLPTSVAVHGQARQLAPSVDLTAYRIVQESLTNALRYAGPTTARVTLSYSEGELRVEVVDGGRGRIDGTPQATGHGIAGMRERAEAVGGTLIAGPAPEGGFRVQARLPLSAP
ncbi:MAG TPA: sensor histidine kinase [Solirubrobacteraceae bacterium]|nr:sensor histidine kinase [Solirubrobacteraceae bacterium]